MTLFNKYAAIIENWSAALQPANLRQQTQRLQMQYKAGKSSAFVDLAAYAMSRAPATFAAVDAALQQLLRVVPDFRPNSILDYGAGLGSASFAALENFDALKKINFADVDERFLNAVASLAEEAAPAQEKSYVNLAAAEPQKSDLAIAAYVFAEINVDSLEVHLRRIWQATADVLLIVEPGTPAGFQRIEKLREIFIKQKVQILGPCFHTAVCPKKASGLAKASWCHFSVRLNRSRAQKHSKDASLPYEDEKFCWLAVRKGPAPLVQGFENAARILSSVAVTKIAAKFEVCEASGAQQIEVPSRNKKEFKKVKALRWGDAYQREKT